MRADIDCPTFYSIRARGLILRSQHAPLKRSGLNLILMQLVLKIIPKVLSEVATIIQKVS